MSHFCGSESPWSEENDSVPLKHRLKKLYRAINSLPEHENVDLSAISNGVAVKREDKECASQFLQDFHSGCSSRKGKSGCLTQEQSPTGGTEVDKYTCPVQKFAGEIINANDRNSLPPALPSNFPVKVKVEQVDDSGVSTLGNFLNSYSVTEMQLLVKSNTEIPDDFLDYLDHVPMKERRRILLSRKERSSATKVMQDNSSGLGCRVVDDMVQQITRIEQGTRYADDEVHSLVGNNFNEIHKTMIVGSANDMVADVPCTTEFSTPTQYYQDNNFNSSTNLTRTEAIERICSSESILPKHKSTGGNNFMLSSHITALVNVKVEPLDGSELERTNNDSMEGLAFAKVVQVKTEIGILDDDSSEDKLDHMSLSERKKLLLSRGAPSLDIFGNSECTSREVPSAMDCRPIASEYAKPLKIIRPRKRKRTATDSVGMALEEDAPGLLQVLVEKGVLVDEMKLYGQTEHDGDLDDSSIVDSFSELEAVMLKLFSERSSLLKFAPMRCMKGEKAIYCLNCLFSLVEQARYLRFRNWPVEWGWCRDLQSFIFVFKRHNRIVLERPEYGYATYFFELVDSLSIDWQIKRLVTAMKLTSCSRVTLIENRALVIGEDLSEGEARVLLEFGWLPNSGLGTMLNYHDRVVHDRKNEKRISDWREKIGKLLADGYNGGRIVSLDIPSTLDVDQTPQIKLELN